MKIGIMSFAHMHAYSYANCIQRVPDAELVAIFDENCERGKAAATDYDATYYADQAAFLSSDIDAVIICSENNKHKEMVIEAAKAKKQILCEKPIATNIADAKEMIAVCEEHHVMLQIAFPVRFSSGMQSLKKMIDAGELGEILAFRSINRGQNPGGWFIDNNQSGGGAVLDHTVHMVDIMRWYTGKEVTEVFAIVDSYFHNIETDDASILTLEFEDGIIASHDASWSRFKNYPMWGDAQIEVIGTKQSVIADGFQGNFRLFHDAEPLTNIPFGNDMDFGLIADFIDRVKNDKKAFVTGYDGLKASEVALAAYESAKQQKPIKL